jgi:hypothetical protein
LTAVVLCWFDAKKPSDSKRQRESRKLGARAFAAISAIEGLELTAAGRKRVRSRAPTEQRRAEVLRVYRDLKGAK